MFGKIEDAVADHANAARAAASEDTKNFAPEALVQSHKTAAFVWRSSD